MNNTSVLSWQNETTLSPHPLERSIGPDSLLIDANFVQFDNFVPVLNAISAENDKISFEIQFDRVLKVVEVDKSDLTGVPYVVTIREGTRYLGKLVLGADALNLYDDLASRRLITATKFLKYLVKSIPAGCGVYKVENLHGAVELTSDSYVNYDILGQDVTFSAVALPEISTEPYLKTLNLISPVQNNVYMKDSPLVKISSNGGYVVGFSLVGTGIANLLSQENNTIPTNPNP